MRVWYRSGSGAGVAYDDSNAAFAIGAFLTVTAPNGGEAWTYGSTHNVTWTIARAADEGSFDVWAWGDRRLVPAQRRPHRRRARRRPPTARLTLAPRKPLGDYHIRVWYSQGGCAASSTTTLTAPSGWPP